MKLTIQNKSSFIDDYLKPISHFAESAILNLTKNKVTCLVSSPDDTVILNGVYSGLVDIDGETKINIPNVDKLISALKIIDADTFNLEIGPNYIRYKSLNLNFKFHVYEDGVLMAPRINIEKVNQFKYDTHFTLTCDTVRQLLKSASFTSDTNKLYLFSTDNRIIAELTDRTIDNSDMFSFCVTEDYEGSEISQPVPIMLEAVRSFATLNRDINVSINNDYGIVKFEIFTDQSKLMYIVTSIVA